VSNLAKHVGTPEGYAPVEAPARPIFSAPAVPTPPAEGWYANPSLRLNWPGLSTPDSLRQAYVPGVRIRRFFPVSNS
jgi:hypothetical protein